MKSPDSSPSFFLRKWVHLALLMASCTMVRAEDARTPISRGVKVEVMVGRPSKLGGGDFDDMTQVLEPRVKLTNQDAQQTYEGYKAIFLLLGDSTIDNKIFKVLQREEFDLSLPPRQVVDHRTATVTSKFDTTGAKFGFRYDGWILVIKDPKGAVVYVKATSPSHEKQPEQVSALMQESCYNKQLKAVSDPARR